MARFAELDRLLEPFGGSLLRVESDRLVYRVNASPEQLRAQLSLARLHEVSEDELPLDARQPMGEGRKALNPPSRQQTPRAARCCASAGDPPPAIDPQPRQPFCKEAIEHDHE